MPTYAYECQECGNEFEKFQSMTANALRKCPECGKLQLRRLVSGGSGFQLKGAGWHADGYSGGSKQSKDRQKFDDATK